MPLPGGPANKLGNRYEQWWTVLQLMRVIRGEAAAIEIEQPGLDFAEFVVKTPTVVEYHQARVSHPSGKWTLSALSSVLRPAIGVMVANPNATFTFVSRSDARDLGELSDRARDARGFESFWSPSLDAAAHQSNFQRVVDMCPDKRPEIAYLVLRRIHVTTIDEDRLRQLVDGEARLALFGPKDSVLDRLYCLVTDSVHRRLDRAAILSDLATIGARPRQPSADGGSRIDALVQGYLQHAKRRLIHRHLVSTPAASALVERVVNATHSTSVVVTGSAGSGKSASLYGAIETLRSGPKQMLILPVRLDRLSPTPSADELGEALKLGESPALALGVAAEVASRTAVLVVDQLDAVSTVSGRRSEFLDAVAQVLEDVEVLRRTLTVHVVLACRKFDWDNDHRLRRLVPPSTPHVVTGAWSDGQVKAALDRARFDSSSFSATQIELLRLPLHLALLLDSSEGPTPPEFSSANDLFDLYWSAKRQTVNARAEPVGDYWLSLIQQLSDSMSESQQLSVPTETLDGLPPEYVEQASSEGVIAVDRRRITFWHESFFDYCFARTFIGEHRSLVSFIVTAEQLLFRRAQVRQVLQYLRDADLARYCRELGALLCDTRVRWHVKDVAVAVAMSMDNPSQQEWDLFEPWIADSLTGGLQQGPERQLTQLVGRHFFGSDAWFPLADSAGLIRDSLQSVNKEQVEAALGYLSRHQEHRGDAVARLLSPHVGDGETWDERFRRFFYHARLAGSRPLFDLFLALLRSGKLDPLFSPGTADAPFWFQIRILADSRPEWIPEVLAVWLQRVQVSRPDDTDDWHERLRQPNGPVQQILKVAEAHPLSFVRHILPPVLAIAEMASGGGAPPIRDPIWSFVFGDQQVHTVSGAVQRGLAAALTKIVAADCGEAETLLQELRSSRLYLGNWLLLNAYAGGNRELADRTARELCADPWRFECGTVSNPYWTATQLVAAIAPRCSSSALADLERSILEYRSGYEKTVKGRGAQGLACFNLLSGIPRELRSPAAQRRYQELERRFHEPYSPPSDSEAVFIGSPIRAEQAAKMNDEQWLRAISKHDHWRVDPTDISKGGPLELSYELTNHVRAEPDRFAELILQTPPETNPHYIAAVLRGLKDSKVAVGLDLRLKVCRKAYAEHVADAGGEIADLLGAATEELPVEAVKMLASLATDHPDPSGRSWREIWDSGSEVIQGSDLINAGINSTRGKAVGATAQLIKQDSRYAERFRDTAERIVGDPNPAVRAVAGAIVGNVTAIDSDWAFRLFSVLLSGEPREEEDALLATPYIRRFFEWDTRQNFIRQRPFILRALQSDAPEVNQVGAEVASSAVLFGSNASDLVEMAHAGSTAHRLGIALVAAEVVRFPEHREWAEAQLKVLFDDPDPEVQRIAAGCFRSLEGSPLEAYEALILYFCSSRAFPRYADDLLRALEKSSYRLPGIVCTVLIGLFERSDGETWNIQSAAYIDPDTVVKLVIRIYHQHPDSEWASKCLDLFDKMSVSGMPYAKSALEDYER